MTTAPQTSKPVFWWLVVVGAMVCAMILVGGATRLTDSGLSITEWKPVTGAIPPLSQEAWQAEFDLYRASPEYQLQNRGMSLAEFEFIYWWEWGHRFLGRMIGLVFFLPLVVFWVRKQIPQRLKPRLVGLLFLGGLQGFVGWWMVASGLVDRVDVSQYRLAAHLSLAFVILGVTLWLALEARNGPTPANGHRLTGWALGFWCLVLIQIALGAFVAGLDAGRIFNTWPGMDGRIIPEGYLSGMSWFQAAFESLPAVQMHHRWTAYLIAVLTVVFVMALRRTGRPELRKSAHGLAMLVGLQIVLGIAALLASAPLWLSLLHQGGAIALFLMAGVTTRRLRVAA
ncbi:COX15/CtaA family protein [Hyphobacterium marinum]|uniref:Heme A synthase n=1 Tax=Hyphobacterium marinum TaxID=3116574 RepID=A0ABU7LYP6_9PROT|nr:COX15/CtaA family protein [Hyphobacterium sp. Y6023]MEE2566658.1 COX15/CtaA family protein [Hyphobacterium sp. Y6023]